MTLPLLRVENLSAHLVTRWGTVKATNDVSFSLDQGETLGIVGESGSGKSITCLALLRLLPPGGQIVGGRILFNGEDLVTKSEREMRTIRGRQISMILQDPLTSLNPLLSIGEQVAEPIRLHQSGFGRGRVRDQVIDALRLLKIPAPEHRVHSYPHELSGGMRQRVMGAIAMSSRPQLLIADEPTTSLDVTVQAQYLELLQRIQDEQKISIIFVTHDLGIVAQLCHRVVVMYAGRIVETVRIRELFDRPAHPYTIALLGSLQAAPRRRQRQSAIEGQPPALHEPLPACPFAPRCRHADQKCFESAPPLVQINDGHSARCWRPIDGGTSH